MRFMCYVVLAALFSGWTLEKAAATFEFDAAQKLQGGGSDIATESPGYASPCFADIDGDGVNDLLVGQFAGGKIAFYKGSKKNKQLSFAKKEWLQANGGVAKIPGVW